MFSANFEMLDSRKIDFGSYAARGRAKLFANTKKLVVNARRESLTKRMFRSLATAV